jgi:hypothetical protein
MDKENKRTNNDLQSNPQKIELHAPHKIPGVNWGVNVRSSWRELRYSGNVSSSWRELGYSGNVSSSWRELRYSGNVSSSRLELRYFGNVRSSWRELRYSGNVSSSCSTSVLIHVRCSICLFDVLFDFIYCAKRHFQQYFSYIMATSFSSGGSQSTRREPPTMGKQLVIFITCGCESSASFCNLQSRARTHAVLVIGLHE